MTSDSWPQMQSYCWMQWSTSHPQNFQCSSRLCVSWATCVMRMVSRRDTTVRRKELWECGITLCRWQFDTWLWAKNVLNWMIHAYWLTAPSLLKLIACGMLSENWHTFKRMSKINSMSTGHQLGWSMYLICCFAPTVLLSRPIKC